MSVKSGNLNDYLAWRGDLTFSQSDLNVVDALAFSVLTYVNFGAVMSETENQGKGITLFQAGKAVRALLDAGRQDLCTWILNQQPFMEFFFQLSETRRFRNLHVCRYSEQYDPEIGQQFAAMTFLLPGHISFVAFRGTDNTMTGWKEDMNMSFLNGTPGQFAATDYVNSVAARSEDKLCIGGHSKGGNFAVWAGVNIAEEYRSRVSHIYNNDGPGFTAQFLKSDNYLRTEPKILSFVPESSIVGVLLSHCDYVTIKSTSYSVLQHDPFSWEIIGKRFVYDDDRTKSAKIIEQTINGMVAGLTAEEKSALVEEIFTVLDQNEVNTTDDFKKNIFKHLLVTLPQLVTKVKKYGIGKAAKA